MNPSSLEQAALQKPVSAEELRQQLIELDNRFALLGGKGVFDILDQAGVLRHRLEQVGDIDYAITHPPLLGRARLRGEFVRDHSGKQGTFACDWMCLWDGEAGKQAPLADPFCASLEWNEFPKITRHFPPSFERRISDRLRHVRRLCDSGCYAPALEALHGCQSCLQAAPPVLVEEFFFLAAFLRSRCGVGGGTEAFTELVHRRPASLLVATLGLQVYLHAGLVPHPHAAQWLLKGEELLTNPLNPPPRALADFLTAKAAFLNRSGRTADALAALNQARPLTQASRDWPALTAGVWAESGESHRLLGNRAEAQRCLRMAQSLQTAAGCKSDLGRHTLLYRAKLERSPNRARLWLAEAERVLRACGDKVGLLKAGLLQARLAPDPAASQSLKDVVLALRDQLPAIQSCPKLDLILRHWAQWCGGQPAPDNVTDPFWNI